MCLVYRVEKLALPTAQVQFNGMNQRNQDAIKKTAAGMLKLLHPQLCPGQVPRTLLEQMVAFAVEMQKG